MSFSEDVRRELAHDKTDKKCCVNAEIACALIASDGLSFRGPGQYGLSVYADTLDAARRYTVMFQKFFRIPCGLRQARSSRLGGKTRYQVLLPDKDVPGILRQLRLLDSEQLFGLAVKVSGRLIERNCCRVAFLRGAYLAGGSMDNPQRAYHMEISTASEPIARQILQVMEELDLSPRMTVRKGRPVVYLKDSEQIVTLLAMLGANQAVLFMENVRIVKSLRNEANRAANCDSNNVDKAVEAAERQLSMIETIDRKMGLDRLPPNLREIAMLRRQFPDANLTELGREASPPLGKSGVYARMRKLEALAEALANE
ncbi:MAG: DNA-binding protein WhiA [Clostridia bacterium]|nr:DNA-binding protein WhiA [Clostridia bacterium]